MGEPVDKDPWGELEPEEGTDLIFIPSADADYSPQKKRRSHQTRRRKMRTRLPRPQQTVYKHLLVSRRHPAWPPSSLPSPVAWRHPTSSNSGRTREARLKLLIRASAPSTKSYQRGRRRYVGLWVATERTTSVTWPNRPYLCSEMSVVPKYVPFDCAFAPL